MFSRKNQKDYRSISKKVFIPDCYKNVKMIFDVKKEMYMYSLQVFYKKENRKEIQSLNELSLVYVTCKVQKCKWNIKNSISHSS